MHNYIKKENLISDLEMEAQVLTTEFLVQKLGWPRFLDIIESYYGYEVIRSIEEVTRIDKVDLPLLACLKENSILISIVTVWRMSMMALRRLRAPSPYVRPSVKTASLRSSRHLINWADMVTSMRLVEFESRSPFSTRH